MALSIIGTPAAVTGTTITLPTHAVGDLIVLFAYKDGATSIPTKPSASGSVPAWVTIDGPTGANTNAAICAYFVATSTTHTSGTWTGATGMSAIVIRGQHSSPIGGHAQGGSTGNGTTQAPTVTLTNSSGSSMLLHFVAHRTVTAWSAAPAGYTRRASVATEIALNTKDTTTTAPAMNQTATTSNSGYRGQTVEVVQAVATVTGAADITVATDLAVAGRVPQSYAARIASLGPVMHLRLGEPSGTTATDAVGANDGTYVNAPTLGVTGALTNDADTAITLNGTDEYLTVADDATLDVGDVFTIEFWLNVASIPGSNAFVLTKGTNSFGVVLRGGDGLLSLYKDFALGDITYSSIAFPTGGWHHVAITKNGSTRKLYIDGVDRTTLGPDGTIADTSQVLSIGRRHDASSYLPGSLDEVALYSTALSAADVLENYNVGITGLPAPTVTGAADITIATSLDVAARNNARGAADITVGRVLDVAGRNHAKAVVDTARTVTLDVAARNQARGAADTTASVTLDVAGRRTVTGAADITASTSLDVAARNQARGAADTTATATLDVAARNTARAVADTTRVVTLDVAARNHARAAADTTAAVDLAVAGEIEVGAEDVFGAADVAVAVTLGTAARNQARAAADTLISVTADAQGRQDAHGALDLAVPASVDAAGTQAVRAAADTTVTVTLDTAGRNHARGAADTTATTSLDVAGVNHATAAADHTATVGLAATAYEPPPAFPTTGVLDSFDRADGAIGANWTNDTYAFGATAYTISGNQAVHPSGDYGESWWNASTFGPNCEAYVTIGTLPDGTDASVGVNLRVQSPGTSGADGYRANAQIQAGNVVLLRMDNGAATTLDSAAQTWAAGDKLGLEAVGDQIKVYRYSGGTWTELLSATDSTYAGAGHIGMWSYEPGASYPLALNDFGGGTVVAAPVEVTGAVDHAPSVALELAGQNQARAHVDTVAVSTVDAAGQRTATAALDTTTAVALNAAGRNHTRAAADHTTTSTLDVAGRQVSRGAVDHTASVELATAARNAARAAADTSPTVTLDTAGRQASRGAADHTATVSLHATADVEGVVFAQADHTATVALEAAGRNHTRTTADTSATVELAVAGEVEVGAADVLGAASYTAAVSLDTAARNHARAAADHAATVSLDTAGVPARTAAADTTITTSLDTAGRQRATGHLAHTTSTSLNAAGYQTSTGTLELAAVTQLAVAGFSFAGVVGRIDLDVTVRFLVANIYGTSTLTTVGATTTRTRERVLSPEYANEHPTATIQPSEEPDTTQTLTTRRTTNADALVRTP